MFEVPFRLCFERNKFREPSDGETERGQVDVFEQARLKPPLPTHPL